MYKKLILVILAVKGLTGQCLCDSPSKLSEKAADLFEQSMAYAELPARIPIRIVALHKLAALATDGHISQTLVPLIEQATSDPHVAVREAAVLALFAASPHLFWQTLPRIIDDDDDGVRLSAASCVWKLYTARGFEVPVSVAAKIQELCEGKQLGTSELGFALLAKCFDVKSPNRDKAREVLASLLSSQDPPQLQKALEVAGLTDDPSFVPLARSYLEDPRFRSIAIIALIRLNHGLGTSVLLQEVTQADSRRCLDAILSIGAAVERTPTILSKAVRDILEAQLGHQDARIRNAALRVLRLSNVPEVTAQAKLMLNDPIREVRLQAAEILAARKDPTAIPVLFESAAAGLDFERNRSLIPLMGTLKDKRFRGLLLNLAQNSRSTSVKAAAFVALANLGFDGESEAVTIQALESPEELVRQAAAEALIIAKGRSGISIFAKMMERPITDDRSVYLQWSLKLEGAYGVLKLEGLE